MPERWMSNANFTEFELGAGEFDEGLLLADVDCEADGLLIALACKDVGVGVGVGVEVVEIVDVITVAEVTVTTLVRVMSISEVVVIELVTVTSTVEYEVHVDVAVAQMVLVCVINSVICMISVVTGAGLHPSTNTPKSHSELRGMDGWMSCLTQNRKNDLLWGATD